MMFFLCFEIILRIIEPKASYVRENEFIFYEYDEILGWKNKPNESGMFSMPDSKSYVRINSKGLRDSEHNYTNLENKTRIQFYGDSFTWGYGVNEEERYTNVFKNNIKNLSNEYEVINLGTTGYGTDQEYLFLKDEGIKYDPDIVILSYHNDVGDVSQKEAYTYPRPFFIIEEGVLQLTNVPVPNRTIEWEERYGVKGDGFVKFLNNVDKIASSSKAYVFLRNKFVRISFVRKLLNKLFGKKFESDAELEIKINKTLEVIDLIILNMKNLVEKNNALFIIVLLPDKSQVYGKGNTIEIDHLVEFCDKNEILLINLLPDLGELGKREKDLYFKIDGHFSEKGNEIVGELLFQKLIERRVLHVEK